MTIESKKELEKEKERETQLSSELIEAHLLLFE